jgi:indolepyruvate ferredoxin oxidoreductase, alpha subunit
MAQSPILREPGSRVLLMGNEAIARGAVEAGVQLVAAYPGTPSSEVTETLISTAPDCDYYVEWSTNEKVAFEVAAGAAMVGARALTAMKNAGLNVAMDTYVTLPYGGVKGGMVIVVADDPDAHYSSTEQDTRTLAMYAEIPCLEPMDQQEAKDMTKDAFDLSEQLELPVFLRTVTRISHASGDVRLGPVTEKRNVLGFNKHYKLPYRWDVYGAPGAVHKHKWLHDQFPKMRAAADGCRYNRLEKVKDATAGILTSGVAAAYAAEAVTRLGLDGKVSVLKLGMVFPLPGPMMEQFLAGLETLVVVEEGDPMVELQTRALAKEKNLPVKIRGKSLAPVFEPWGEINADLAVRAIATALGMKAEEDAREKTRVELRKIVTPRSSTLCAGCSHLGSYWALKEALKKHKGTHIVNGDIGCYEQGGYGLFASDVEPNDETDRKYRINSPYEILDTIYVMGSGIGLAQGQVHAGYKNGKVVAVCGDSTFIHATLPPLVNAVYTGADITFLIFDNRWTAMTGHQVNPSTGVSVLGEKTPPFSIEAVVKSVGVGYVKVARAYDLREAGEAIEGALAFTGTSVVILTGECQLQVLRRTKKGQTRTRVDRELCTGCKRCVQLGCPAVTFDTGAKRAGIDEINCTDCGLCIQVCPEGAISLGGDGK